MSDHSGAKVIGPVSQQQIFQFCCWLLCGGYRRLPIQYKVIEGVMKRRTRQGDSGLPGDATRWLGVVLKQKLWSKNNAAAAPLISWLMVRCFNFMGLGWQ